MSSATYREPSQQFWDEFWDGQGVTLAQAAKLMPWNKKPQDPAKAVWRWIDEGYRGQFRLEGAQRPNGDWITTRGAVQRFLARVTRAKAGLPAPEPDGAQAERQARAEAVLAAGGM